MIYRLKYAKSESNFDADFEHPTFQGVLLWAAWPSGRAAYMGFCPLPLLYPSASDFQFRYAPVTVGSGRDALTSPKLFRPV